MKKFKKKPNSNEEKKKGEIYDSKDSQDKRDSSANNRPRNHRPRNNSRRRSKETEINISDSDINKADLKGVTKSQENDGAWYSHYPDQVVAFGSIPFSYPLGTPLPIKPIPSTDATYKLGYPVIPGMMALDWYPVIGQATGYAADPINQAANKIYVYVRHTLSTYASYDASDMMMYILSMDSIYTLYSELVRIYGIAQNWKVLNRYYAKAMLEALGIEPSSVLDNLANFRGQLNEIAYMLNQFVVPAGFDYITRHTWMASSLFIDGEAVKSQTYFYRMAGYYEFTEVTEGPAYLKFTRKQAGMSLTQQLSVLKRCISLVMNSQDCIAMSGDLLKAFGASGTFVALPVSENYIVEPIYSKEVLSQIENATILGYPLVDLSPTDPVNGNITQMTIPSAGPNIKQNVIVSYTNGWTAVNALRLDYILNFHKPDVTPIEVMIATRLSIILESVGKWPPTGTATATTGIIEHVGSEILANATMYYYTYSATDKTYTLANMQYNNPDSMNAMGTKAPLWSCFDWAPRLIGVKSVGNDAEVYYGMDIDNYAVLSKSDLAGLHSTAMMSLFEVPAISKLNQKMDKKKFG